MSFVEQRIPLFQMSSNEVKALSAALVAFPRDEVKGNNVHLRVDDNRRMWIIESHLGRFVYVVDEANEFTTPGWLQVSDRLVRFAETADASESFAVGLELVMVDDVPSAFVVSAGSMSAVIDAPEPDDRLPADYVWATDASSTVGGRSFTQLLNAARTMPSGADREEWLSPPMWLKVGDGQVALHVDWSDVLPSRSTYRVQADDVEGETTVSIPHALVSAFLMAMYLDEEPLALSVLCTVDEDDNDVRQALQLTNGEWFLDAFAANPLVDRWDGRISDMVAASPYRILCRGVTEWLLDVHPTEVTVTLHHGHPDIARVSAVVVSAVEATQELLVELNALNVANTGVRLFHADDTVRAVADVRLSEFDALRDSIPEVARQSLHYGDLLAAFGAVPPQRSGRTPREVK